MANKLKNRTVEPDGEAIQRLRIEKGWRVEDLANKAGCSLKTVENVEKGENIYLYTLKRVANALDVEPSELLIDVDDESPVRMRKKERVWKITLEVSTPYDEFDESSDLVGLLQALMSRLGGGGIEPTGVKEGSTLIEVEMTLEQFLELAEAYADGRLDDLNIESIAAPDDLLEQASKSTRSDKRGGVSDKRGHVRRRKLEELRDRVRRAIALIERKQGKMPR
jgi:transcriptional regulator with XRE-family HTH domain